MKYYSFILITIFLFLGCNENQTEPSQEDLFGPKGTYIWACYFGDEPNMWTIGMMEITETNVILHNTTDSLSSYKITDFQKKDTYKYYTSNDTLYMYEGKSIENGKTENLLPKRYKFRIEQNGDISFYTEGPEKSKFKWERATKILINWPIEPKQNGNCRDAYSY